MTNFPMQESHHVQPPENIPSQPEIDPSYTGVNRFPIDVDNTSAPVRAGDRPTNRQPPVSSSEDMKGKVFAEAMDQYGCRSLHQKLHRRKPEDILMIFSELKDYICKLMIHQYGSFVVQKLFKVCNAEQMDQLVSSVTTDPTLFMSACLDPQGAESMKKFLKCITTSEQISHMISFFCYFLVPLINDQFGSLVIGHCFRIFTAEVTKPIREVILDKCLEIAISQSGSCLLRVILSKYGPMRFHSKILLDIYDLSTKQFGNRVVRHVIGLETPYQLKETVAELSGGFAYLSMDKYGSKVVKKLMKASKRKFASRITKDIISSPEFLTILVDPFGYSVLETSMKYAKGNVRKTLLDLIRQHSELLNKK